MEIKMSADQANHNEDDRATVSCVNMESVQRIVKLPVVESTISTATSLYGKVKDYNNVTNWTLQTAENTMYKAVEVGKPIAAPVVKNLEGPIKTVDGYICSGLDYVEAKVPAVKLPAGEIYTSTKEYVSNTVTPVVESACAYVKPGVDSARKYVEPAVQSAKTAVEPAVQTAKNIAQPYVQPALDTANAIKDYGTHKVDEFLHRHTAEDNTDPTKAAIECTECQENSEKLKQDNPKQK